MEEQMNAKIAGLAQVEVEEVYNEDYLNDRKEMNEAEEDMQTTLKAKPTTMTAEEIFICNNDKPMNDELLAEHIHQLEWVLANPAEAKKACSWVSLDKQLDQIAYWIASLTV